MAQPRFATSPLVAFGYAVPFMAWSVPIVEGRSFVERFEAGAFADVLARLKARPVRALVEHDVTRQIATTADGSLSIEADDLGLVAYIDLSARTSAQVAVIGAMRAGRLPHMSIEFDPTTARMTRWTQDGIEHRSVWHVERLIDVSLCARPAYMQTAAQLIERPRVHTAGLSSAGAPVRTARLSTRRAAGRD